MTAWLLRLIADGLTHVWHEVLGAQAQLIPIALVVRGAIVIALTELLYQLLAADISQLLLLCCDQQVDLVSR